MTLPPGDHESLESVPSSPTGTGSATRFGMRALVVAVVVVVFVGVATGLAFTHGNAQRLGNGVVVIETNLGYENGAAAGTGMVLSSSGEVLTNNHVIRGATTIRVVVPGTGHSYTARVVGYDVSDDVAVLQAQHASNLKTIALGHSSNLTAGDSVTALGNAGGTGRLTAAKGTITGLGKTITASDGGSTGEVLNGLIETDAGVEPGDSGGPLLNEAGQVIGMDTAASTASRFASETGNDAYAIPIGKALTIVKQIESGERSTDVHIGGTAFLGIEVQPVDTGYGYGYGYGGYGSSEAAGAQIASVVGNAPAAAAGLEAGDVITAIDGRAITSASSVAAALLTEQPGTTVAVAYIDPYGTSQTTSVTLATGPAQ